MSSMVELSKSSRSPIKKIKERLSKTNKRLKLFKDTVFGKYLDLDVEDNDNHLLNYVHLTIKGLTSATSVHDDVGLPDAAADINVKATSICNDIDKAEAPVDYNAKSTSAHDDVGVPDAAADDNAKATSVCDDINEVDAAADDNAKATSVHDDVGVPDVAADDNAKVSDAAADDNAKATSVHDDVGVPDAAADDNAKATSIHDDVGVPDAAADDNAKATSVWDDIDQADSAAYDNAKVPISDVYNTPVDNKNELMKDAHEINNHTYPPIHGFQIMLWGGLEKKGDGLDEAKGNQDTEPEVTVVKKPRKKRMSKRQRELPTSTRRRSKRHIQEVVSAADNVEDVFQPRASKRMKKESLLSDWPPEVVSAADNGEAVKETQLPDLDEDVFQPHASKIMKNETLSFTSSNSFPESYKRFQRAKDKNTRPQRSFGLFKSNKEATSLVSLGEWLELNEKFAILWLEMLLAEVS
ncbi:hypothetical protein Tco_0231086 [Tanacetum coccineum]